MISKLQPPIITRFAPSPTGYLHLGHVYAAKFARDLAVKSSGDYILRFEDIDITRVKNFYYDAILEDLEWLGIQHSGIPIKQINRSDAYESAFNKLKEMNVLYPCFCTRKEIQRDLTSITSAPHHSVTGQLCPKNCRALSQSQISEHLSNKSIPTWRINTNTARDLTGELYFDDLSHGRIEVNHDLLGDAVLTRRDIGTSYHIAVVVDDAFQNITHVTRGEDLLDSTHLHRILQNLLDLPCPIYQHHRLIKDDDGERLAKRAYSETIRDLRELGHSQDDIFEMIRY